MRLILTLLAVLWALPAEGDEPCPYHQAFVDQGWVIHETDQFHRLIHEKLHEFLPDIGTDLVIDHDAFYVSEFSHDDYLIIRVVIWDRLSTDREEMWGDIAICVADEFREHYVELRWYDPATGTRHIVCNPEFVCCLSTKVPLAYNTIF